MASRFLAPHGAAILFALLAGALTLFPQLIVEYRLGDLYQGVHKEMNNDEGYYTTRAQEVIDGHSTLGNPYLYEQKAQPPLQVWIPEAVLAWGSMLLFHDLRTGWLAWDFIFPALILLLTYAVLLLLTANRVLSTSVAVLLSIGVYLEVFNRSPSPQVNFAFLLLFIYAFFSAIKTKKKDAAIASVLLLGAMFYIYTYYWTYIVVLLGITGLSCFVFFRKERLHAMCAAILGGGLVLGIPYFYGLWTAKALPYYGESLARVGLITTHSPSGLFIVGAGAAILLWYVFLWRKNILEFSPVSIALASGVLAGMVAVNQHIITGLNLEFSSHYHWVSMYADFFALTFSVNALLERAPEWRELILRVAAVILILFSFASAAPLVQKQIMLTPDFISSERYGPILRWLDANTRTDDVVYANDMLSYLIPAYTRDNVFYTPGATLYIMPQRDIRMRFLLQHYFGAPFTRDDFSSGLALERQIYGNFYIEQSAHRASLNTLRRLVGLGAIPVARYPEDDIASLIEEEKSLRTRPFLESLSPYRVDYILWDKKSEPEWRIDRIAGLSRVYEAEGVVVYKIAKGAR